MASQIEHFILVFDHASAQLVADVEAFGRDAKSATRRYEELEQQYRELPQVDIVLVGSDSIETVRMTHANYFNGTASVERVLSNLLRNSKQRGAVPDPI